MCSWGGEGRQDVCIFKKYIPLLSSYHTDKPLRRPWTQLVPTLNIFLESYKVCKKSMSISYFCMFEGWTFWSMFSLPSSGLTLLLMSSLIKTRTVHRLEDLSSRWRNFCQTDYTERFGYLSSPGELSIRLCPEDGYSIEFKLSKPWELAVRSSSLEGKGQGLNVTEVKAG